ASLAGSVAGALSAIGANSAQMTSADNAISAAAAAASAAAAAASAAITSVNGRVDSVASIASAAASAAAAASGNVTSARDYLSLRIDSAYTAGNIGSVAAGLLSARVDSVAGRRQVLGGAQTISATIAVSISGFTFTVSANVAYGFDFLIANSTPISLNGLKLILSTPSGGVVGQYWIGGGAGTSVLNINNTDVTLAPVTVSAVGVAKITRLQGQFFGAAGTIQLRAGGNVSGAAAGSVITIMAGSYGHVWRIV
ncbi:MAG: hypothetical protein ACREEE_02570, partial [Dongiaceae bacterium]